MLFRSGGEKPKVGGGGEKPKVGGGGEKPKVEEKSKIGDYPKDQAQGDAFRQWMSDNRKDFKCGNDVLENRKGMSFKTSCMKQAWKDNKDAFLQLTPQQQTELTKKVEFPINTIERSNKFRKWLKNFRFGFFSNKKIKEIISDLKDDADKIKDAWSEYGNEFIEFLLNSSNSSLQALGKQIYDENQKWEKTEEGSEDSFEKEIKLEIGRAHV